MLSLTATELPRFMACNGSRLLGGQPPFEPDTTVTDEGNAVHWLIEQVFSGQFTAEELVDRKAPNGVFITADMVEDSQEYLQYIQDFGGHIEIDTSYGFPNSYEVRGRADHITVNHEGDLIVSDFKYGWKIVEPENNWTLISHAIGFLTTKVTCQPSKIYMRIYQPRPYHPQGPVREWVISIEQLMELWQQLQQALTNPSDHVVSGDHCYKCPSRGNCPAFQVSIANAIDVAYSAYNANVSNDDLPRILENAARAAEVLKQTTDAYEDMAKHRLKAGQIIDGYGLQNDLGRTRWKKDVTPELVTMLTGVDVAKPAIITPNQAKKAGVAEEVVESLTERPNNGTKLVRVNADKRGQQLFGKKEG